MACMLHKQVLQGLLVSLFHKHKHTHTHARRLPSGSGPSTLAPLPCRQLQYAKAQAVTTTKQHWGRYWRAQSTWETVKTSYLDEILSKPAHRAIQQVEQGRSVYAGWKGVCMRVCSVVSNFAIPWTVAPPQTAAHGFSVPGILQARTLEWVAISFSSSWKWKVKVKSLSRVDSQRPHGLQPTRLLHPWDFPGKSTWVGCHFLLRNWGYGDLHKHWYSVAAAVAIIVIQSFVADPEFLYLLLLPKTLEGYLVNLQI